VAVKRAIFFGLSGIVALAGCRAIIGIDDLEKALPDAGGKQDGKSSSGSPEGGNGGKTEAGPGPSSFDINSCLSSSQCRPCCKQNIGALKTVFEEGAGAQCLCAQSTCKDECIDGICASPPVLGPPKPECAKCTDDFLGNLQGNPCESTCGDDQDCHLGIQCLQNCTKHGQ
jgi:hypothetical protein